MVGEPDHLRLLDLFSGIGGFHLGLARAGHKIGWSGFCEIDKYASAVYRRRFPNAQELGDVRSVQPERDLPDHIDVLCGGFPCQSFSIAGKRRSFEDTRGTLFFEIARILKYYRDVGRPISYFILENVKGLYSAGDHSVLPTIYGILTDLDYTVESQLLNTRWVLPQNRERIFLVGYTGGGSGSKIFPIGETSQVTNHRNAEVASTLQHPGHSVGNYRGMTMIVHNTQTRNPNRPSLTRKCDCGSGKLYKKCCGSDGGSGHISKDDGTTYCLDTGNTQAVEINAVLAPDRTNKKQNGRRIKKDGEPMFTLTGQDKHGISINQSSIRRLTPKECERLQGFPDDWTSEGIINGEIVKMSDTQRYKQCGNAVTVDIVSLVASHIPRGQQ